MSKWKKPIDKPKNLEYVVIYFKSGLVSTVNYHPSMCIWWNTDVKRWCYVSEIIEEIEREIEGD